MCKLNEPIYQYKRTDVDKDASTRPEDINIAPIHDINRKFFVFAIKGLMKTPSAQLNPYPSQFNNTMERGEPSVPTNAIAAVGVSGGRKLSVEA